MVTEAAINNPNVSAEAKADAKKRLQGLEKSGELDSEEAHLKNVERGHKVC